MIRLAIISWLTQHSPPIPTGLVMWYLFSPLGILEKPSITQDDIRRAQELKEQLWWEEGIKV